MDQQHGLTARMAIEHGLPPVPTRASEERGVPTAARIALAFDDLDKAIEEILASLDYCYDRGERLSNRIAAVLDPAIPPRPGDIKAVDPSECGESPRSQIAMGITQRAAHLRQLAARTRAFGEHLDAMADRVEL